MAAGSSEDVGDVPRGVAVAGPRGYDALVDSAALLRDGSRRVFRLGGDRAADMLQGLSTADIHDLGDNRAGSDGTARPTLILTPKGRVLADAVVVRVGDGLLLDVPEAAWPGLEPHFARYLPPRFAKLEPSGLGLLRIRGPEALTRATEIDPALGMLPAPIRTEKDGVRWSAARLGEGAADVGQAFAVRRDGPGGEGIDLYLPAGDTSFPLTEASANAWEIWRVEQGVPLYGRDISEDNLPQETGLVADATSFSKGCYTGQEVLARIHYRGKVNRLLRGLRLKHADDGADGDDGEGLSPDASDPPLTPGDELRNGERAVGSVTSAVRSPRYGWIGLGYVRREIEPGAEAAAGPDGTPVIVVELPFVG
jgi:folate-binding protein YgfZ